MFSRTYPQFAGADHRGSVLRGYYVVLLEQDVNQPRDDAAYIRPVDSASRQRKALWVEIRDSSNGERRIELYDAPIPKTRQERELFLNRYVPMIFPGAKLRTYAGGTGTFIADPLLIAAHYGAVRDDAELLPVDERLPEPVADRVGQGSLFAA